jgi:hypothetical protein
MRRLIWFRYYQQWAAQNLTVLGYFNGWELGQQMGEYPPKPGACPPAAELWRHAPCFIHTYLDAALIVDKDGHRRVGANSGGWDTDTVLDPGIPLYRRFLTTMVRASGSQFRLICFQFFFVSILFVSIL